MVQASKTQSPPIPAEAAPHSWEAAGRLARPWATLCPEVDAAMRSAFAVVWRAVDPALLDLARQRVAMLLGVGRLVPPPGLGTSHAEKLADLAAWPSAPVFTAADRAVLAFTEQFTLDVGGMTSSVRDPAAEILGDDLDLFVKALYLVDAGVRLDAVLPSLFGVIGPVVPTAATTPEDGLDPPTGSGARVDAATAWAQMQAMHRAVSRLRRLDPLTGELARLRVAGHHNCRICQSRRNLAALEAADDPSMLDQVQDYERSELSERHKVALRLTDAVVIMPSDLDDALVASVRAWFTPGEAVEIVLDDVRNSVNKYAVALGTDEARVPEGFEVFAVDEGGTVVAAADPEELGRRLAAGSR